MEVHQHKIIYGFSELPLEQRIYGGRGERGEVKDARLLLRLQLDKSRPRYKSSPPDFSPSTHREYFIPHSSPCLNQYGHRPNSGKALEIYLFEHESIISPVEKRKNEMSQSRRTPVVVGVADVVNRSKKVEDAIEPLELILRAIKDALKDTGLSDSVASDLQSDIDSLDVVRSWTWPYPDLPSLVAKGLNIKPTRRYYSEHAGNQPGKLFDEAARRISLGESKVAVLTGGEALASRTRPILKV